MGRADITKCLYAEEGGAASSEGSSGAPPSQEAILRPNNIRQLCSVSNLPFLGKVIEEVVGKEIQKSLDKIDYLDAFQARFRLGHSIEIVLVALVDDL